MRKIVRVLCAILLIPILIALGISFMLIGLVITMLILLAPIGMAITVMGCLMIYYGSKVIEQWVRKEIVQQTNPWEYRFRPEWVGTSHKIHTDKGDKGNGR